ncbi:hypothetical protein QPK87_37780 [Kamptonema cortianum]|nr:hypothetical protein [Kamptonema cortianum]
MSASILSLVLFANVTVIAPVPLLRDAYSEAGRVFGERADYNAKLVARRQFWDDEPILLTIMVGKNKGEMSTVIQPSTIQGQTFLDDGKRLHHFIPDENTIYVSPSSKTFLPSSEKMVDWLRMNYTGQITSRRKRLGRSVRILEFEPRHQGLPSRTIVVDSELPVMQSYVAHWEGKKINLFEVLEIQPLGSPPNSISLPSNSNTKTIEKFGPKPVKDLMVAAALLGFQPSRPKSYPLGFVPYAEQIVGKEAEPAYGTRLTDGMALVTVYQWPYTGSRKKTTLGSIRAVLRGSCQQHCLHSFR